MWKSATWTICPNDPTSEFVSFLLDTNVLIHLRDGDATITSRVASLDGAVMMSVISRVELEGGVYRDLLQAEVRRPRLEAILATLPVLAFDDAAADAYRLIVASSGYSRRKLLDRMIAAQALVHRATMVTQNPRGFEDIPSLDVLAW